MLSANLHTNEIYNRMFLFLDQEPSIPPVCVSVSINGVVVTNQLCPFLVPESSEEVTPPHTHNDDFLSPFPATSLLLTTSRVEDWSS